MKVVEFMADLFDSSGTARNKGTIPLSEKMRPKHLKDVVGQDAVLSSNGVISSTIGKNRSISYILFGPPGVGKTTIGGGEPVQGALPRSLSCGQ